MRFEIADWRFEVTWGGLLCQPIERGPADATKKPAAQSELREGWRDGVSKSNRRAIGLAVKSAGSGSGLVTYSTGSGGDLVMKELRNEFD